MGNYISTGVNHHFRRRGTNGDENVIIGSENICHGSAATMSPFHIDGEGDGDAYSASSKQHTPQQHPPQHSQQHPQQQQQHQQHQNSLLNLIRGSVNNSPTRQTGNSSGGGGGGSSSASKLSIARSNRSSSHASSVCGSKKTTLSSTTTSNSGDGGVLEPSLNSPGGEIDRLKLELRDAKRQIYEREQQLLKLHREIHKLRSVLDHSDAINALKPSLSMTMLLADSGGSATATGELVNNQQNISRDPATTAIIGGPCKKQGVSGESYGSMTSLPNAGAAPSDTPPPSSAQSLQISFVWKDFDCRRIIQEALLDNSFLKNYLNAEQMNLIVDSMYEKEFAKNCYICRRGTYGSHLFVITYGHCEVIDAHDKPVNQMGPGKAFGELALLYNCTRTASVKTITRVRTWVLDRKVFQMIMMKTCLERSQSIKDFLRSVPLLQDLSEEKISKICDAIEVDYYPRGDYICRQGSFGDSFYIISKGSVRVTQVRHHQPASSPQTQSSPDLSQPKSKTPMAPFVKEETIRTLTVGDYFGEQALLLNFANDRFAFPFSSDLGSATTTTTNEVSPVSSIRTANVISEDCECLVLDQTSFFTLLGDLHELRYKSYKDYFDKNDFANRNQQQQQQQKQQQQQQLPSPSGAGGKAAVTSPNAESGAKRNLAWTGSDGANQLTISTSPNKKVAESVTPKTTPTHHQAAADPFITRLTLNDLEHICQLGMGGFGIVNLVRARDAPERVFAIKRCSKDFVRTAHQEAHIINEKLVMQRIAGRHQFVVQLFRTFRDVHNVYFLMETALGGELWTVLRQRGPFNESSARFYVACVIEALQFLHQNNIIYRDLKPENCLLDAHGYLKLTDFGFSKFLQPGDKTWTFCGTPEYVAPEIVLNRGHDRAVDIWSIGILLYELLTGMPPFTSPDPLKTYHIILRGFDSIGFDARVFSKQAVSLIRALCRESPPERLGVRGRNGFGDIRKHKWFAGFAWSQLIARRLTPPIVPQLASDIDTRYFETVPLQPDGSKFPVVKKISGTTTATTPRKKSSFSLRKNSAKLSNSTTTTNISPPTTTCQISPKRSTKSNDNEASSSSTIATSSPSKYEKESPSPLEYSFEWENYF